MNKKIKIIPKNDYPWVSINTTQAEDKYELYIALTEKTSFTIYLDNVELEALEEGIKAIRHHLKYGV